MIGEEWGEGGSGKRTQEGMEGDRWEDGEEEEDGEREVGNFKECKDKRGGERRKF